ncbi:MAG: hypothetical protein V5A23_01065 [Halobacteriales archaeon]
MGTERHGTDPWEPLSERELETLHRVEVAGEWIRRAQGHLLAFHHAVGHAMDHLDDVETALRAAGHEDLADPLRDDVLVRGVAGDRWSYDIVEAFESSMVDPVAEYEAAVRESLSDGERHLAERRQRARWRDRARE